MCVCDLMSVTQAGVDRCVCVILCGIDECSVMNECRVGGVDEFSVGDVNEYPVGGVDELSALIFVRVSRDL